MRVIDIENISKKYTINKFLNHLSLRDKFLNTFKSHNEGNKTEEYWALKKVNLSVEKGEILGIIGLNGAGKSTLLKLISRVTTPTNGSIKIIGRVSSLLEVGTGFHPELTGRENIFLNGVILGMSKKEIDKIYEEIVEFSGIGKFIDTPVKKYSSGMYLRLAFSVAAHVDTDILIIDEVLAVGDMNFQKKCFQRIDNVTRNKKLTSIIVSHNLSMLENICTKIAFINDGKVECVGKPGEIINRYYKEIEKRSSERISERNDRSGNGNIKIVNVKIKNQENKVDIKSGDGLKFFLEYKSFKKTISKRRRVIIAVYKNMNIPVFKLDSNLTKDSFLDLSESGEILCETGIVNLGEGEYSINLSFYENEILEDHIVSAESFFVRGNPKYYNFNNIEPDQSVNSINVTHSFKNYYELEQL